MRSLFKTEQITHYYERSDIEFYESFVLDEVIDINHQKIKVTHKFGFQIKILLFS